MITFFCLDSWLMCLVNYCWPLPAQPFLVLGAMWPTAYITLPLNCSGWWSVGGTNCGWPLPAHRPMTAILAYATHTALFPAVSLLLCVYLWTGTCLLSYCIAVDVFCSSCRVSWQFMFMVMHVYVSEDGFRGMSASMAIVAGMKLAWKSKQCWKKSLC
jgi:hypothetical protein